MPLSTSSPSTWRSGMGRSGAFAATSRRPGCCWRGAADDLVIASALGDLERAGHSGPGSGPNRRDAAVRQAARILGRRVRTP